MNVIIHAKRFKIGPWKEWNMSSDLHIKLLYVYSLIKTLYSRNTLWLICYHVKRNAIC